jgi:hypothetical protein
LGGIGWRVPIAWMAPGRKAKGTLSAACCSLPAVLTRLASPVTGVGPTPSTRPVSHEFCTAQTVEYRSMSRLCVRPNTTSPPRRWTQVTGQSDVQRCLQRPLQLESATARALLASEHLALRHWPLQKRPVHRIAPRQIADQAHIPGLLDPDRRRGMRRLHHTAQPVGGRVFYCLSLSNRAPRFSDAAPASSVQTPQTQGCLQRSKPR